MRGISNRLSRNRASVCIALSATASVAITSLVLFERTEAHAQAAPPAPPAPAVTVETIQAVDLKKSSSFSGRVEAIDKIELRTRVSGFIMKREFREGAEVTKDQLLFEIDPRPYKIALAQAEANLASSNAALADANDAFNRTQELVHRQVSSEATLSGAQSRLSQAKAKVEFDKAQVEHAKLNVDFTQVRAPISGRIGRASHALGDYVSEGSTALATLISHDVVYVNFQVPRAALAGLTRDADGSFEADVEIRHGERDLYPITGKIAFVDIEANSTTNTLTVRAEVPNPKQALMPQELVDVALVERGAAKSLVVSQAAMLIDQEGPYVLAVNDENKVELKRCEVGGYRGALMIIKSGLAAGERVIVGGHLKAQPGMLVAPEASVIEVSNAVGNPTP